ncbi:MAG: spondin domain-containing protein [Gammaproteobacteria bacterium]|nr:spondin domain-containing protein [Gammaproteobacteria bacterium]MDH3767110.1 spondin domain-containing protein [Gammaproteobacteria bacterium]
MTRNGFTALTTLMMSSLLFATTATADSHYEVTVTNLTKGMTFTPIMVATTRRGDRFFRLGDAPSDELEAMAETGDVGPLQESLDAHDVSNSSFLPFLSPGKSVTQFVATTGEYKNVSLAAMLIPSNDIFFALNGIAGPTGNKTVTLTVPAYDAGSELNDELCVSLPGPGCGGDPGPISANGEGYVYVSNGIRGIADLDANALDFNNPVAQITITRISSNED